VYLIEGQGRRFLVAAPSFVDDLFCKRLPFRHSAPLAVLGEGDRLRQFFGKQRAEILRTFWSAFAATARLEPRLLRRTVIPDCVVAFRREGAALVRQFDTSAGIEVAAEQSAIQSCAPDRASTSCACAT
jgi:hypothetical protein